MQKKNCKLGVLYLTGGRENAVHYQERQVIYDRADLNESYSWADYIKAKARISGGNPGLVFAA